LRDVVLLHHERYNGSGYPKGLRGNDIPLAASICAIADTFEGMTSERPYKHKRSTFEALNTMGTLMKGDFHPSLLTTFVNLFITQSSMA